MSYPRVFIGVGPQESQNRRLLPLETIYEGGWGGGRARGRYDPRILITNYVYEASTTPGVPPLLTTNKTPLIYSTQWAGRSDIARPPRRKSTLFVDLGDFEWPAHLLKSTTVDFRITQRLDWPKSVRRVLITSPKIQVEGKLLRDFLEKLKSPAPPTDAMPPKK